jgi:hypothetical protein
MAVLGRVIAEFWLAFVGALVWATFRTWPIREDWGWVSSFIANFVAAFFFVSYFTGQFLRIKRQTTLEETMRSITSGLVDLTSSVGRLTMLFTQALAKETALQPIARELSDANAKLAEANNAVATTLGWISGMADTPLVLKVFGNPAAQQPMSDWAPKPPDQPKSPPPPGRQGSTK